MLHRTGPPDFRDRMSGRSERVLAMLVAALLLAVGFVAVGGVAEPLMPSAYPAAPSACPEPARPFAPRSLSMPGIVGRTTVVALGRDRRGVPRTPPISTRGKWQVAWDQPSNIMPGSRHGNVRLNAHTYPDGSALGNRLLRQLFRGQRIVVLGAGGQRLCYDVTRRIKVSGDRPYGPYYDRSGDPQLAIVVCSGQRRGPGNWSHRTIWFAAPVYR